jgi:hypothetical protein
MLPPILTPELRPQIPDTFGPKQYKLTYTQFYWMDESAEKRAGNKAVPTLLLQ